MNEIDLRDLPSCQSSVDESIGAGQYGQQLMRILCRDIGARPSGSPATQRAIELLAEEWSRLGAVNVHREEVPVPIWTEAQSSVQVITPLNESYASIQSVFSGSRVVTGRLVADLEALGSVRSTGQGLHDAIVLMGGHQVAAGKYEPLATRVRIAQDAGASAVILASSHPQLPCVECMIPEGSVNVPVLSVPGRSAARLADLLREHAAVSVRVTANGQVRRGFCHNLVGEIAPEGSLPETIILGAHLDSLHFVAPGAVDNATGVVVMTEVARALAPLSRHFARRLRLIAYTGEEYGFLGGKEYVRSHEHELDCIRFVLNMDSLFESTAQGIAVMWSPAMRDYIAGALHDRYPEVDVRNFFCMSSDYLPFMLSGIPAARPADWRNSYPSWVHTVEDTCDRVPDAWLRANALVYAHLLLTMLTDRCQLPAKRLGPEEVRNLLDREGASTLISQLGLAPSDTRKGERC